MKLFILYVVLTMVFANLAMVLPPLYGIAVLGLAFTTACFAMNGVIPNES